MTAEMNIALVRQWVDEGWNRGQFDLLETRYAPDYTPHWIPAGLPVSRDGLRYFISAYRAGMPDFHMHIEDVVADGDRVVFRFTCTGTQTGELFGVPPTGKFAAVSGIVIARFRDGLWLEDWANYDQFGMLQQLGVIPEAAPATA